MPPHSGRASRQTPSFSLAKLGDYNHLACNALVELRKILVSTPLTPFFGAKGANALRGPCLDPPERPIAYRYLSGMAGPNLPLEVPLMSL